MELLNRLRDFKERIANEPTTKHQRSKHTRPDELRHWVGRVLDCRTIQEIETTLQGFSQTPGWTLEERAIISSIYAPKAAKLLSTEEAKYRILENLSSMCWSKAS